VFEAEDLAESDLDDEKVDDANDVTDSEDAVERRHFRRRNAIVGLRIPEPELASGMTFRYRTTLLTAVPSTETWRVYETYDAYRAAATTHPDRTHRGMVEPAIAFFEALDALVTVKGGTWDRVKRNTASKGLLAAWHIYLLANWTDEIEARRTSRP
jgi:hypothetical protein